MSKKADRWEPGHIHSVMCDEAKTPLQEEYAQHCLHQSYKDLGKQKCCKCGKELVD